MVVDEERRQVSLFTVESATVYRAGGRRYFTKSAALRQYAKTKFKAKHPCECEHPDPSSGYPGYNCGVHDVFDKVMPRYLRWLRRVSVRKRALQLARKAG